MTGHRTGWELQAVRLTRLAVVVAMIAAFLVVAPPAHAAPAVTVTPVDSAGTETPGDSGSYTVVLDELPTGDVTVTVAPDSQVTVDKPTLTFTTLNWADAQTVTVTPDDDSVVEGSHSGVVSHSATGGGYDLVPIVDYTITITDNDVAGVTVTPVDSAGTETPGDSGSYTVVLDVAPSATVTVTVSPDSQVTVDKPTLTFTTLNWADAQTVTVTPDDDSVVEGSHSGVVSHSATGGGYDLVPIVDYTITITDNDFSVAFVLPSSSPTEGNVASTPVDVDVVLDTNGQNLGSEATVEVYRSGGDATSGSDFTFTSPTIVRFPKGSPDSTTGTVTINVTGDTTDEANETVILGLQNVSANGSIVSPLSHTLNIIDDDGPPGLSILDATPVTEGSGSAVFTVRLLPASGQTVTVNYATADGTATSPADYTAASGTLTFTAGQTTKRITVPITQDNVDEISETLLVNLSGEVNTDIGDPQGTGTILDDDNVAPGASIQITDQADNSSIEFGVGELVKVTVTFTDPGDADTHSVTLDWGDGTAPDVFVISPVGTRSFVRTHTYASAGLYQISASVSDADGGSDSVTGFVSVSGATTGSAYATGLVDPSQGKWYLYDNAGGLVTSFFYGNPGDYPFMGDWDGDGIETPGLYRQSDGFVYLKNSNTQGTADISFFFGNPSDVPIAGDFNGNGFDTVSIYRPSNQTFYIINELGKDGGGLGAADVFYTFGNPGDKPFVGDFDGDGIETVGLHRESTGLVYFRNEHSTGNAQNQFLFGNPGDRLVAGDWTGDGVFTPALFRPSSATMFFKNTNTQGNADNQFVPSPANPNWLPVSGVTGF